jgi:hypothetical protein
MSTERVEIKPDTTEKSLEQSADDLKNAGVDVSKDVAVNADGEGAKISQISQEEMQQSSQDKVPEARPEWLPEKFKNAEELAKAYGELEKSFSSRKQTQEQPKDLSIQDVRKAAEGQEALGKFYDEYAQNNSLSDKSYEELATKHNLSRELVDGYIEGQKAISETQTKTIHDIVGGADRYAELTEWAAKNLSEAEQQTYNNMVDSGNVDQAKFAVQGLMSRAGVNYDAKQPELFEGGDQIPNDSFESVAQVTEAMNDPRYEKDPAYRKQVTDKIARSSVI